MDNRNSKNDLSEERRYNAEHEARDEQGRFTSEDDNNRNNRSSDTDERRRDSEGRFESESDYRREHRSESDGRGKNSKNEKSGSHGGSHGHSGK